MRVERRWAEGSSEAISPRPPSDDVRGPDSTTDPGDAARWLRGCTLTRNRTPASTNGVGEPPRQLPVLAKTDWRAPGQFRGVQILRSSPSFLPPPLILVILVLHGYSGIASSRFAQRYPHRRLVYPIHTLPAPPSNRGIRGMSDDNLSIDWRCCVYVAAANPTVDSVS